MANPHYRGAPKDKGDESRINGDITVSEVRLVGSDGQQVGIVSTKDALAKAKAENLDLVEVAPMAKPPVCRLLDYGKFRYEKQRQAKLSKKKQHVVQVKEIRIRPSIDEHDLNTKLSAGTKFLQAKNKLKVTVMFRGREMARMDRGEELLNRVVNILQDEAKIEKAPETEGRRMTLILAPK